MYLIQGRDLKNVKRLREGLMVMESPLQEWYMYIKHREK